MTPVCSTKNFVANVYDEFAKQIRTADFLEYQVANETKICFDIARSETEK